MNKKLQEIGKKLNITKKDIQRMQKGFISKKILVVIVGVVIAILAFIVWFLWKKETEPGLPPGYPFSPPETPTSPSSMAIIGGYLLTKKKNSKVAGFLISTIAFLSSWAHSVFGVFGQAVAYNVYKKKSLKDFLRL